MRRREFITLLGGTAAAWPLTARAQQPALPVVGFLRNTTAADAAHLVATFRQGLRETGYVEKQNVAIEFRWSEGRDDQLPAMVDDLVRHPVAVLVAANISSLVAAKAATTNIPIVFVTGDDPVQLGLVDSLNRPAGNVTGISFYSGTLGSKQVDLLHELVPAATLMGMVANPHNPGTDGQVAVAQTAAKVFGLQMQVAMITRPADLVPTSARFAEQHISAVLIGGDALFNGQRNHIAQLASRYVLPTIHFAPEYVKEGGLISYGADIADAYRQVGVYVGRLLQGTKISDLPIMLPTKFELLINLKTAQVLGLAVPTALLALADQVIE
jgi:putative tryptophan/tyrosine transport system substrate-binding protein